MKRKGFTLIELMVVIAIIGLLAAIALPRFAGVSDSAKVANVQGNLSTLRTSIAMFHAKNDAYPTLKDKENSLDTVTDSAAGTGEAFTEFYGKSILPETPAHATPKIDAINTITESTATGNKLFDSASEGSGGWSYRTTDGAIRAYIKEGAYGEKKVSDGGIDWSEF